MSVAILSVLAVVTIALLVVLTRFLKTPSTAAVRVFSPVAMVVFPALWLVGMLAYADSEMRTVSFCTSCHEMQAYGNSLESVGEGSLAAEHYRDGYVDRTKACYTCHTNPGLAGYVDAKMRGMNDVRVHYLGEPSGELELVAPYLNAVCLKCHGEAEGFLDVAGHQYPETLMDELRTEETSCLDCHGAGHILED